MERQSDYTERTSQDTAGFFHAVAYAVGGIMALGALFGALNTMYSAVGARTQEIATLRALGFGGTAVAVSVIAESVLLALAGARSASAWRVLFHGQTYAFSYTLFHLTLLSPACGYRSWRDMASPCWATCARHARRAVADCRCATGDLNQRLARPFKAADIIAFLGLELRVLAAAC